MPILSPARSTLNSLKQRVFRAGGWAMTGLAASQMIRFGSNLVMTRLLVPEMFGIMAIAYVFLFGLNMFSDIGLRQIVVRSDHGEDQDFLNSIWVAQILRGGLICLVGLMIAVLLPLVADTHGLASGSVYSHQDLPRVIGLLSLTALISGFESTKKLSAGRRLVIGRLTTIEIVVQICGVTVMVAWASIWRSIDALVFGTIISGLLYAILTHAALPGANNRFTWNRASVSEIRNFGKWVFVSSAIGFFISSGDRMLMGALLGAASFGVYTIAALLATAFLDVVNRIATSVAYPALSEIYRERPEALCASFYKVRLPIDLLSWFIAGFLFEAGGAVVHLLYDSRYHDAGRMLEILSLTLLTVGIDLAGQCFLVMGRPKLMTYMNLVRFIALFTLVPLFFHAFGVIGAIWGISISYLATIPLGLILTIRLKLFCLRRELVGLPAIVAGIVFGKIFSSLIG